ncbi:zinc finger MYM-type protein 1 [Trichonephila clavipes]|uniref:Zinc finger MYM-type protein 1 n=1 Tax=Trichonephila clavipes TaxID=2585209 RepID=A0A8X6W7M7_TRICX|nr:zinc finger MYM-type protein 1 [Trichonephila clavipes]
MKSLRPSGLLQQIYVFFSAWIHRWELLNHEIKLKFTLKSLSRTKWSCPYDAVEALKDNYAELAERWTELPQVSDESRSFFRVHTGYFSNIPKCIKAEFIASWGCSQSSVVSSSQR